MSFNEVVLCPFCAYKNRLIEFRLILESGVYSKKRYKCPDCGQIMRKNTLTKHLTLKDWAYWLYASIRVWDDIFYGSKEKVKRENSFYYRISWNKLLYRISLYGYGEAFWEAWREVKKLSVVQWTEIVEKTFIDDFKQSRLVI